MDREAIRRDRQQGMSLNELARTHHLSKATICKILKPAQRGVTKGACNPRRNPLILQP